MSPTFANCIKLCSKLLQEIQLVVQRCPASEVSQCGGTFDGPRCMDSQMSSHSESDMDVSFVGLVCRPLGITFMSMSGSLRTSVSSPPPSFEEIAAFFPLILWMT